MSSYTNLQKAIPFCSKERSRCIVCKLPRNCRHCWLWFCTADERSVQFLKLNFLYITHEHELTVNRSLCSNVFSSRIQESTWGVDPALCSVLWPCANTSDWICTVSSPPLKDTGVSGRSMMLDISLLIWKGFWKASQICWRRWRLHLRVFVLSGEGKRRVEAERGRWGSAKPRRGEGRGDRFRSSV